VWVFNPGGIGGLASTLRWSPLVGCKDPHTAARRAIDLMGPTRAGTEGERWDIQGRRVLGVFLHAAALGGHRMRDGQAWVANPDAGRSAILTALDRSPQAIEMRQAAEHAITVTPKTRDGVMLAIAPAVPLERWMAELRKRSITIHAACQGLGQLRQRWGDDGASMILNSAAAVLVFGGAKDADDLALFGQLAGERDEVTKIRDANGSVTSTSTRRVPVISAAHLASLKNHRALLIRRGMPVALARTPIAWKRRDVRQALAADRRSAGRSEVERVDQVDAVDDMEVAA